MIISDLLLLNNDKYSHIPAWTLSPRVGRAEPSLCTCSCPAGEYGRPEEENRLLYESEDAPGHTDCTKRAHFHTCPLCSPSTTIIESYSLFGMMVSSMSCFTSERRNNGLFKKAENVEMFHVNLASQYKLIASKWKPLKLHLHTDATTLSSIASQSQNTDVFRTSTGCKKKTHHLTVFPLQSDTHRKSVSGHPPHASTRKRDWC